MAEGQRSGGGEAGGLGRAMPGLAHVLDEGGVWWQTRSLQPSNVDDGVQGSTLTAVTRFISNPLCRPLSHLSVRSYSSHQCSLSPTSSFAICIAWSQIFVDVPQPSTKMAFLLHGACSYIGWCSCCCPQQCGLLLRPVPVLQPLPGLSVRGRFPPVSPCCSLFERPVRESFGWRSLEVSFIYVIWLSRQSKLLVLLCCMVLFFCHPREVVTMSSYCDFADTRRITLTWRRSLPTFLWNKLGNNPMGKKLSTDVGPTRFNFFTAHSALQVQKGLKGPMPESMIFHLFGAKLAKILGWIQHLPSMHCSWMHLTKITMYVPKMHARQRRKQPKFAWACSTAVFVENTGCSRSRHTFLPGYMTASRSTTFEARLYETMASVISFMSADRQSRAGGSCWRSPTWSRRPWRHRWRSLWRWRSIWSMRTSFSSALLLFLALTTRLTQPRYIFIHSYNPKFSILCLWQFCLQPRGSKVQKTWINDHALVSSGEIFIPTKSHLTPGGTWKPWRYEKYEHKVWLHKIDCQGFLHHCPPPLQLAAGDAQGISKAEGEANYCMRCKFACRHYFPWKCSRRGKHEWREVFRASTPSRTRTMCVQGASELARLRLAALQRVLVPEDQRDRRSSAWPVSEKIHFHWKSTGRSWVLTHFLIDLTPNI